MLRAYLREATPDFVASRANADVLFALGCRAAETGAPVLLARLPAGPVVGWSCAVPYAGLLAVRERLLCGLGTYVAPAFRHQGIATRLRRAVLALARAQGYQRIQGVARSAARARAMERRGGHVRGFVVETAVP